jgi:hypothetical protein
MKPLEVNDPVTVIGALRPEGLPRQRHVCGIDSAGYTFNTKFARYLTSAEGVRWIRGHHTEDSPEGQALLAAAILVCAR